MLTRTAVLLALSLVSNVIYGDETYSMTAARAASSTTAPDSMDTKDKCQEEWRKYQESQACFAPYRLANGGIKAEAFQHCVELKQPEFCR